MLKYIKWVTEFVFFYCAVIFIKKNINSLRTDAIKVYLNFKFYHDTLLDGLSSTFKN